MLEAGNMDEITKTETYTLVIPEEEWKDMRNEILEARYILDKVSVEMDNPDLSLRSKEMSIRLSLLWERVWSKV